MSAQIPPLGVAITFPISSSSCERAILAMRRIIIWLSLTMDQDRFSNIALLHIEMELSKEIRAKEVVQKLATKERRLPLF